MLLLKRCNQYLENLLSVTEKKENKIPKKGKNEVILNNHDWPKKYLKQKPSMAKIQTGIKK